MMAQAKRNFESYHRLKLKRKTSLNEAETSNVSGTLLWKRTTARFSAFISVGPPLLQLALALMSPEVHRAVIQALKFSSFPKRKPSPWYSRHCIKWLVALPAEHDNLIRFLWYSPPVDINKVFSKAANSKLWGELNYPELESPLSSSPYLVTPQLGPQEVGLYYKTSSVFGHTTIYWYLYLDPKVVMCIMKGFRQERF